MTTERKFIPIDLNHPAIKAVSLFAVNSNILEVKTGKRVKYYNSIKDYCEKKGIDPNTFYRKKLPINHKGAIINKIKFSEI